MARPKLMLLGGLRYLLPVIDAAHAQGCEVITCDYLPDNIAHRHADHYDNVSIVDREAVLALARKRHIDGILSFAVDPGVVTAAYVAEQLGLPSAGSYEAVRTLQNKDLFRKFLTDNGFNCPVSGGYESLEALKSDLHRFRYPLIVKPTDAAGSKGVTRVDAEEQLPEAFRHALDHARGGRVIVEEFIEKLGCSSDSDCFSVDGRLVVATFSAQRFDNEAENPYTPSAYSWPSTFTPAQEAELRSELQRLITLLGLGTSVYNVETRIGTDGKPYIMEVSPRGGGNRLSEMIRHATGTDLVTAAVRAAVGLPVGPLEQRPLQGHWAEIILHAEQEGRFRELRMDASLQRCVVETDLWVAPGEPVHPFRAANDAIGTLVLRFDTAGELEQVLAAPSRRLHILTE